MQVLFCPGWIAALFAVGAVGCLCYQYYELFVAPPLAAAKPGSEQPVKLDQAQPKTTPSLVASSHEIDVEEAFRLAKASQGLKLPV